MNRCDDRVEPLFATDFPERVRSHCLRAIDKVNALAQRECPGVGKICCEQRGKRGRNSIYELFGLEGKRRGVLSSYFESIKLDSF